MAQQTPGTQYKYQTFILVFYTAAALLVVAILLCVHVARDFRKGSFTRVPAPTFAAQAPRQPQPCPFEVPPLPQSNHVHPTYREVAFVPAESSLLAARTLATRPRS